MRSVLTAKAKGHEELTIILERILNEENTKIICVSELQKCIPGLATYYPESSALYKVFYSKEI